MHAYWKELYSTEDDWQVINDLVVLDKLTAEGDVSSIKRKIDQWIYIEKENAYQAMLDWLVDNDYLIEHTEWIKDERSHVIQFCHLGTTELKNITHHRIKLNRKANEELVHTKIVLISASHY